MSSGLDLDRSNLDTALGSLDNRLRVNLANIIEHPAVIGRGGFSSVTVGDLTEEGISLYGNLSAGKVEIKRLFSDSNKDLRVAFRLIREVKIWEKVDHHNILKLLGFHLSPNLDVALIICPWEPRGSINKYIGDAKPNVLERLGLLLGVAAGLTYLHRFEPAVCHGDIKGDNVLVDHRGQALLCDFGLAKLVEDGHSGLSTSSNFHGSVRWCSPELFHDSPRSLASDIWAFGCVVIEVIYECTPYKHIRSNASVMLQALNRGLPAQPNNLLLPEYLRQKPIINLWDLLEECWKFKSSDRADAKRCTDSIRIAYYVSQTPQQIEIGSIAASAPEETAEVVVGASDPPSGLLLDTVQRSRWSRRTQGLTPGERLNVAIEVDPLVTTDDEQDEYIVEDVIDSQWYRSRFRYLVKWEGYDISESTWTYLEDMGNAQQLIDIFHRTNPDAPHPQRPSRPTLYSTSRSRAKRGKFS
ncbi:hypothetical protein FRB93_006179 [Tulasnella sp. JGI-2019a]|nr:hypothetical protein FRB93_006179 [Tulasnella sp. JGI-2019a]